MQLSLPLSRNLLRSTTAQVYADQAIVSGLSFLSSVILARYLGVKGFGIYSMAWIGVMIASSINQPLITTPMQTLSGKKNADEVNIYLQALVFKQLIFAGLISLLSFGVVILISFIMPEWNIGSVFIALPLAVFSCLLQDFFRRYFFIKGQSGKAMLIDAVAYGGTLLSAFALHFIHTMDAQFVLLLTALFYLYASLIALFSLDELRFNLEQLKQVVKEHWDFSKWLTATAILQWFSGNLFIIAAGAILGPIAVGATRMAQNIVGVTHVLFLAMENIIPVKAANEQRLKGNAGMFAYLWRFTFQMGAITFTILGLLAIFNKQVIHLFYGEKYMDFGPVLVGFCLLYVIVFLGYPLRYAIRTLEKTRLIFISFIASSVFSMIAAYPVIKAFGVYGVVLGLMITQLITNMIYLVYIRQEISRS